MTQPKIEEHPDEGKQLTASRWREALLTWFDTWRDKSQRMPSDHLRSSGRLLRACVGLAEIARADGSLRPAGGSFWNAQQLADHMAMSKSVAIDTLAWLAEQGWMSVVEGKPTKFGLGVDERRLVLPTVHQVISEVNRPTVHDPSSGVNHGIAGVASAATVHKSPSHGSPPLLSHGSPVDLNGERHPVFPEFPVSRPTEEEVQARGRDGSSGIPATVVDVQVDVAGTDEKPVFQVGDRVRNKVYGDGTVEGVFPGEIAVHFDKGRFDRGSHDKGVIRRIAPEALELIAA